MSGIIFEALKLLVMIMVLVACRYVIPWVKQKIGTDKLEQVERWTKYAVEMAQQVHWEENGADKKAIVTEFLKGILTATDLALSEEQLDVLIESAVKEMKIAENTGITITATNDVSPDGKTSGIADGINGEEEAE